MNRSRKRTLVIVVTLLAAGLVWWSARAMQPTNGGDATIVHPLGHRSRHTNGSATTLTLTGAELSDLNREISDVLRTNPVSTVEDAENDGFRLAESSSPPFEVHLGRPNSVDTTFDLKHPKMLLAASSKPDAEILAYVYWVETESPSPPEGFTGGADVWHHHDEAFCIDQVGTIHQSSHEGCLSSEQRYVRHRGWMLHVWAVPGFENPAGVFSPTSPCLDPSRPPPRTCGPNLLKIRSATG